MSEDGHTPVPDPAAPSGSQPPAGPPPPAAPPPSEPPPSDGRPGLPWEAEYPGMSLSGLLETLRAVLFSPAEAFARMRRRGNLGVVLLYIVILGTLGSFFALLWQSSTRTILGGFGGADFGEIALTNSFGVLAFLVAPIIVLLAVLVQTLLIHVTLLVFGGSSQPAETTLRVVCYGSGSTYVWNLVPVCGAFIGFFWGLVVLIIGMREAHEIPGGRAAASVLVPIVLFLCCCGLIWAMVLGAVVGAINS